MPIVAKVHQNPSVYLMTLPLPLVEDSIYQPTINKKAKNQPRQQLKIGPHFQAQPHRLIF
jgi:hypothetical protein